MNTLRGPVGRLMGQCGLTCSPPCSEAPRTLSVCRAGAGRLDDAVVSVAVKAPQTQRHGPGNADPLLLFANRYDEAAWPTWMWVVLFASIFIFCSSSCFPSGETTFKV